MRATILSVCTIVSLALVSITHGQPAQGSAGYHPTVRSRTGKPLHQLFSSDLPAVVVVKDQAAPLFVEPPPGMPQLEWLTSLVPYVFVVRVETMDAHLSPEEDWIVTTVTARIEDVLKNPVGRSIAPGTSIHFSQDGGGLTVHRTRVRAVLPWTEGFTQGRRYLVFASRTADAMWQIEPASSYQVHSATQRLTPLARQGKFLSDPTVRLDVASARIRAQASKVR